MTFSCADSKTFFEPAVVYRVASQAVVYRVASQAVVYRVASQAVVYRVASQAVDREERQRGLRRRAYLYVVGGSLWQTARRPFQQRFFLPSISRRSSLKCSSMRRRVAVVRYNSSRNGAAGSDAKCQGRFHRPSDERAGAKHQWSLHGQSVEHQPAVAFPSGTG